MSIVSINEYTYIVAVYMPTYSNDDSRGGTAECSLMSMSRADTSISLLLFFSTKICHLVYLLLNKLNIVSAVK